MLFKIIKLFKPAYKEYEILTKEYQKRISSFIKIENIIIHHESTDIVNQKLFKIIKPQKYKFGSKNFIISLDENGNLLSSIQLSQKIQKFLNFSYMQDIIIIVGGPYGINEEIKNISSELWSLSKMTLTSDSAWLILYEQIYRALTIIHHLPYHH